MIWERYYAGLLPLAERGKICLPDIPDYATNSGHIFFIVCRSLEERTGLISFLKDKGVGASFHYLSLHKSEYFLHHSLLRPKLPNCDKYADRLVRMPMYFELDPGQVDEVVWLITEYYG